MTISRPVREPRWISFSEPKITIAGSNLSQWWIYEIFEENDWLVSRVYFFVGAEKIQEGRNCHYAATVHARRELRCGVPRSDDLNRTVQTRRVWYVRITLDRFWIWVRSEDLRPVVLARAFSLWQFFVDRWCGYWISFRSDGPGVRAIIEVTQNQDSKGSNDDLA